MGLTTMKMQRLKDQGFPKLYVDHEAAWKVLLATAVEFLNKGLTKSERIRADDISEALRQILQVDEQFKKYVDEERLPQKYWSEDFAAYIVDQVYGKEIVKREQQ